MTTRNTIIVCLIIASLGSLPVLRNGCRYEPQRTTYHDIENYEAMRGPNPDGSWGTYAESPVRISGVAVNHGTKELIIYLTADLGTGGKYTTHATLPLDETIKEEVLHEDSNRSKSP